MRDQQLRAGKPARKWQPQQLHHCGVRVLPLADAMSSSQHGPVSLQAMDWQSRRQSCQVVQHGITQTMAWRCCSHRRLLLHTVACRYYFGYRIASYKMANVEVADARVLRMHEVLLAIKLVKFYVWERSFARQVEDVSICCHLQLPRR
jgi:hypothetical protein